MAMHVHILTHTKTLYDEAAGAVLLPATEGRMEVLPRHIPFVVLLDTGVIAVKRDDRDLFECTVSSGIAYLSNDDLTVFAGAAETLDTIDLARANAAVDEAHDWMERHRADPIMHQAGLKYLRRAENRIRFVRERRK
ncbi:MAG TPA: ATP synthase F1 subunit epsilon [bacterium]|nr:ATP synthase F1 subunit epsilon [bacterium]